MKTIMVLAISTFLSVTVVSSFSAAFAAAPGAMSGKGDWGSKGYDTAAKQKMMAKRHKMTKPKPQ